MEVREDQSLKPPVHDVCARGVIVEYEAAARPVPVKPKASWPLRVLMGWFGLGTLIGAISSAILAATGQGMFPEPFTLEPDVIPRILTRNAVYILSTGLITGLLFTRRRAGAIAALLGFVYPFLNSLATGHPQWWSLGYLALGAALVSAVWKELE